MSDEKEKIEKVEASEIEPKEIKKEEKKKDKEEVKEDKPKKTKARKVFGIISIVLGSILIGSFLYLPWALLGNAVRPSITLNSSDLWGVEEDNDVSEDEEKDEDENEAEEVDLEQIAKDVEDILGSYEIEDAEIADFRGDETKVIKTLKRIGETVGYYGYVAKKNWGQYDIVYNDRSGVFYKINDSGDLAFGLDSFSIRYSPGDKWSEPEFKLVVDKVLSKLGFVNYIDLSGQSYYADYYLEVINNELGVICNPNYKAYAIQCAGATWLSNEEKELANGLAEALSVDDQEHAPYVLGVSIDAVKESADHQYQNTTAGVYSVAAPGGGVGLFYKRKNDPNWIYVFGVQTSPPCSKFSDEAKKAFEGSGITCVNPNPDGSYSDENIVTL